MQLTACCLACSFPTCWLSWSVYQVNYSYRFLFAHCYVPIATCFSQREIFPHGVSYVTMLFFLCGILRSTQRACSICTSYSMSVFDQCDVLHLLYSTCQIQSAVFHLADSRAVFHLRYSTCCIACTVCTSFITNAVFHVLYSTCHIPPAVFRVTRDWNIRPAFAEVAQSSDRQQKWQKCSVGCKKWKATCLWPSWDLAARRKNFLLNAHKHQAFFK